MDRIVFWRCVCGQSFFTREAPHDHWTMRLDGDSKICRGPVEKWEGRKIA